MPDEQDGRVHNPLTDPVTKRRHTRFGKVCPMRYRILRLDEMPYRGRTANMSGSGICFRSDFSIGTGRTIALELPFPNGRLVAVGKIRWAKKVKEGCYENGVEFLSVRRQEKETKGVESLDSLVDSIENKGITSAKKIY
ncbi:MAG: PilZ domain-containing protein [Planctomycetes bacterium]|nr:PilZ domain-containing protein [Planctomycetota bacterium]